MTMYYAMENQLNHSYDMHFDKSENKYDKGILLNFWNPLVGFFFWFVSNSKDIFYYFGPYYLCVYISMYVCERGLHVGILCI